MAWPQSKYKWFTLLRRYLRQLRKKVFIYLPQARKLGRLVAQPFSAQIRDVIESDEAHHSGKVHDPSSRQQGVEMFQKFFFFVADEKAE
jgi:hypothetical protein